MAPTATTRKEKATKKPKESQADDDVPQKKKKTTKTAKAATKEPVESENGSTAKAATAKKTRTAAAVKESAEVENGDASKAAKPKPKKTKAAATEEPQASENGATKTAKTKKTKAKPDESEPGTSKPTRATRTKKKPVEETEEVTKATTKAPAKGRKRQAAKAKEEGEEDEPEPGKKAKGATRTVNATVTAWEDIDFDCTSKTAAGESPNFRITSWNVDGIRAWMKKGGLDILKHDKPDVLCLQETKCSQEKLPNELSEIEGYEAFWCSSVKEGYAGVGILSKVKPLSIIEGIDSEEHDEEGRCITAEFEDFYLVNVYVPNAGRKLVTLPKRLDWNTLFKSFVKDLDKSKPVIICGDMNVAHTEIDLANPKTNTKNAGFTVEEREGMTDFLEDGYVDTFRQLYPDKEKAYTFWTYMANARSKNVGWRLDYFIVSERFAENVCDNVILSEVLGSDHCPITLHINV